MIGRILWGWIMAIVDFFQPNRNNSASDPPLIENQNQEDQQEVMERGAMEPENAMGVVRNHDNRHEQLEAIHEEHEAIDRIFRHVFMDDDDVEDIMRRGEAPVRQAIVANDDADGRMRRPPRRRHPEDDDEDREDSPPRRRLQDRMRQEARQQREAARAMRQAFEDDDRIRRQQRPIPPRLRVPDRREMPIQRAIHRVQYAVEAQQEQQQTTECTFCKNHILNTDFADHVTPCATEHGIVGALKNLPLYTFWSSSWFVDQEFYKMRQMLEIEYLEACRDPSKISDMHCIKCTSSQAHNAGGCMWNMQKAAFFHHTDRILNLFMAHYEHSLELKKDRGAEEMHEKHIADFNAIEEYLSGNPDDLDSEHARETKRHETLEQQNLERNKFIKEEMDKNRSAFARMKEKVTRDALRKCSEMVAYLGQNKDRADIGQVLAYRKCLRDEGYEAASRLEIAEQGEADNWFGGWREERNEEVRIAGPLPEDHPWNDEINNEREELWRRQVMLDMWNDLDEDDDQIIEGGDNLIMAEPLNQNQDV
ncbi:hypothetical protein B9Z55_026243 [Caenorhabditis nigoni]|uniref:Uncharacterized protein n=2 Tax=Caenorhabditis nigoni TaxID=1611254 RepID=A0A2G5T298_9PELO|nr:hypothetical protein B9Z55_026243 [Caenorhabditis nigoni]